MKKMLITMLLAVALSFGSLAMAAEEWRPNMNAPIATDIPADMVSMLPSSSIDVKSINGGNYLEVTIYDVKVTSKGVKERLMPEVVRISSGILSAAMASGDSRVVSEYIAEQVPANGNVSFKIKNYAVSANSPVVEHLWGIGKIKGGTDVKYLVLDSRSPWVIYETSLSGSPNEETLAIGILMCPNGKALPLKSLNKGKLEQGKRPELADACK